MCLCKYYYVFWSACHYYLWHHCHQDWPCRNLTKQAKCKPKWVQVVERIRNRGKIKMKTCNIFSKLRTAIIYLASLRLATSWNQPSFLAHLFSEPPSICWPRWFEPPERHCYRLCVSLMTLNLLLSGEPCSHSCSMSHSSIARQPGISSCWFFHWPPPAHHSSQRTWVLNQRLHLLISCVLWDLQLKIV